MKDFVTAAKQRRDKDETITFRVDTQEVTSLRPTEDQMVMLMAADASEIRTDGARIAAYVDFSMAIFDEDSRRYLSRRLLDRDDPFSFEDLMDIVQQLVEEWANRPTKPLSDSTSSSDNGGTSSTETSAGKVLTSSQVIQQ